MRFFDADIKNKDSQEYARLSLYLLDDSKEIAIRKRPMIVICPGGAYAFTSDREAESVAIQFLAMGYHAAVLRYSVAPAVYPTALLEVGACVKTIREHADEWLVDPDQIVVCGFSAGGHLSISYGVMWNQDWVKDALDTTSEMLRPNALILCYPVVVSGELTHLGSIKNLMGEKFPEGREKMSMEQYVGEQVPRCFVWHTYADGAVPVQNSLTLVGELVKHKIPTEFHMFENGGHGLGLANRLTAEPDGFGIEPAASEWINLVHTWMENWILGES